MTSELVEILRGKFPWLDEFDVKIWSCEKARAKPDAVIYPDCLRQLGCVLEKSLFFDDRPPNVEAARRVAATLTFSNRRGRRERSWNAVLASLRPTGLRRNKRQMPDSIHATKVEQPAEWRLRVSCSSGTL